MSRATAGKARKPVMKPAEREFLHAIIIETIDALNIPALVRAAIGSSNPPDPYPETARAVTPSTPQPTEDQFELARKILGESLKRYEAARSRWLKAQQDTRKVNPLSDDFSPHMVELKYATDDYVTEAQSFQRAASGAIFQ